MNTITEELVKFLDESPSCFHAVMNIRKLLTGFEELKENEKWKLEYGKSYYVVRNDSSIIAFRLPRKTYSRVLIIASHSDSPTFKLKTNAIIKENNYIKLNTEKYGGMNMLSWFDRPLSIAGRVIVNSNGTLQSRLVNIDRDSLIIPSVAIHMNRDINDGFKINPQVDMLPIYGANMEDVDYLDAVAFELNVNKEDILSEDLFLYIRQKATVWGINEEFISSKALDDLQCAYTTMKGLVNSEVLSDSLNMCCVFNNEEVGSLSRQGADSDFLERVLNRINENLGNTVEDLYCAIANGYMISADNAHAIHPNHSEHSDPTNKPMINKGIVIKRNSANKYTTDADSEAMLIKLCKDNNLEFQRFHNRSDKAGGSTLGNLLNRHISISSVDIGLPQLAMHSAYETAGTKDTEDLAYLAEKFFRMK